jgi:predicted DNA-binding transcriptional regulator YafY
MVEILVKYVDSGGSVTERRISDIHAVSQTSIDAYCHLRHERRTFRIEHIIQAVDSDTGEVINPWRFIDNGLGSDTQPVNPQSQPGVSL